MRTFFVGFILFLITNFFEDFVESFCVVRGLEFDYPPIYSGFRVVGFLKAEFVAFIVSEDCVAVFWGRFGKMVEAAGLRHLFYCDIVNQKIGYVERVWWLAYLWENGEKESEKKN